MEKGYISHLRKEYERAVLHKEDLPTTPMEGLKEWFDFAVSEQVPEPNAMTLCTVGLDLQPTARIVLVKDIHADGVVFYTNYLSKKGQQIAENPRVSLVFFWQSLERQVRVEGVAEKVSAEESDAYFYSRPRLSQAGAIASLQSSVIEGRASLDAAMKELMEKPEEETLKRPAHWGGYLVRPVAVEFWQGRPGRVHDRIRYSKEKGDTWVKVRLSP